MLRLIVDLDPIDPAFGLALEEAILERTTGGSVNTLRFWVNRPAVIIGRSQSVSAEVDLAKLRSLSIPIIRRISGGGAVYHYPGNLNLSLFLKDAGALGGVSQTYSAIGGAIVAGLSQHEIHARVEGNVIMVGDKKIAGAAQARHGRILLYHMSLLASPSPVPIDSLLLAMQNTYTPVLVPSHPRSLTTLSQISAGITMEQLVANLNAAVAKLIGQEPRNDNYTREELELAERLRTEKYRSDEWNLYR